jgi:hypothetical protein
MTTLTLKAKEDIKGIVMGNILVPNDTGYEEARQIWNAMIDRRPALIAQCVQADDVPPVIQFARKTDLSSPFAALDITSLEIPYATTVSRSIFQE